MAGLTAMVRFSASFRRLAAVCENRKYRCDNGWRNSYRPWRGDRDKEGSHHQSAGVDASNPLCYMDSMTIRSCREGGYSRTETSQGARVFTMLTDAKPAFPSAAVRVSVASM
jgi:hypothetical protein